MKKLKLFCALFMFLSFTIKAQTHHRKTRSDKGKTHSHTTSYQVKKAIKPSSPKKTTTKKKK